MTSIRKAFWGLPAFALAGMLAGCSIDAVIWGPDGYKVIQATESLVADLAAGENSDLLCADFAADLGTAADWSGRSAGEPEKFAARYWPDQAELNPQWSINLEGLPDGAGPGSDFPGDVFFREADDGGLCVVDITWTTLVSVG
ncbi:hypothetical protein [Arthrobacter stackebrandtii]|uniref:hypothetical protein n=1 Tax=Arthrobacter stackebrandtii TaxID=272161 RepID=UPI000D8F2945|nr:hypothetical protein [Arthrobacter stackebrandtii]PYH02246.1 hypothetical protein CVV67_02115 [Arthrobacter stackebrandtii]